MRHAYACESMPRRIDGAAIIFQQVPGLGPSGGRFFETVAVLLVAKGGNFEVRKLGSETVETTETWKQLRLESTDITQLSEACEKCIKPNTLFYFLRNMTAIDALIHQL